jgi:prolyl oligopeptidase
MKNKNWTYPPARLADVTDDYHGTAVSDPYRWLEKPDSAETQAWVAAQNGLTEQTIGQLPEREQFRERLTDLWNYPRHSAPRRRGDAYFWRKNDGLQDQSVLVRQATLDGDPETVIDPNRLSEDGTLALTVTSFTENGRFLAYNLSQSGSDWQTIHLLDLKTGQHLDEVIRWCKFTSAAWLPDNSGFFYARYPAPDEMPDAPPSTHQRVYFHRLGTPQEDDQLVYARPDAPELGFQPHVTDDGRYLLLHVWEGTDRRNRVYYREIGSEGDFIRLLDEMEAKYGFIHNDGPVFYFETDLDAPNGRIIAIDVEQPDRTNWRELIAERPDAIAFSRMVHDHFVIAYLHHAHHRLHVFDTAGTPTAEVTLPTIGTIFDLSGRRQDRELFIHFYSFLYPPTILRYDVETAVLTTHHQPQLAFDPDAYETRQVFYPGKDGTQIPLFLTHKKGLVLDGSKPTLLYGYGGFNISMTPLFSPTRLAWLEQGGIYAQAALRGGSEYGEAWHQAGMLARKQTVFDDFIAAAEWLIAHDYTSPQQLAIEGRSNGGLLVAACLTQRPDLFGAVHCAVPVIDMLRYHKFTAGRYWISEYGNAEADREQFDFLLAYSPLHNVRPGTAYPPTLITTADTDDRVVPLHAKKFAATLQAADSGHNPLLIRIETKAGHGLGKPTYKLIEEAADVYAFLWAALTRAGDSWTTQKA